MSDVVAKSVIQLEIDDSSVNADLVKAEAVFKDFSKRMLIAARVKPTVDVNQFGKRIISIPVDPKTTEAGMKVIQNIVREYTQRFNKEAGINVGVDIQKAQGKIAGFFTRLKEYAVQGIGIAIGQAFTFTISRNIERALLGLVKLPYKIAAAAISAANTQTQAEMKLGKAIEATGGTAKKTTEQLAKNAKALEKLTGTADTTVLAIQSILVASKGLSGTNFDRATESALDLAEVLGGDAVNKAEKLAKALQEPVKALEMLRDEGVSFTEDQQNVVKYFVKVNDLASAQSIILDALEDKYGGAARSVGLLAEKLADAGNRLDTLLEDMGGAALENTEAFTDALDAGLDVLEQLAPAVTASAVVLAELATSIVGLTIGTADAEDAATSFMQKVDEWRIAFHLLGNQATITKLKIQRFLVDSTEILMGNFDLTKAIGLDAGIKALEKGMQKRAQLLAEGLQADRAARRKKQADEAAARQVDADARRQEAAKRLADAKILADADIERTKKEKGEKKRLSQEKAAEDKRLKEEERTRLKAQQDFEKSMGRDSLVGLHQRIQDAMYLRKEEAAKKKQDTAASAVNKGGAAGAAGGALASAVAAGVGGLGAAMSAVFSAVVPPGAKGKKGKAPQTQEEIDADSEKERINVKKAEAARQRRASFDAKQREQLDAANTYDDNQKWYKEQADKETQKGNMVEAARLKYQAKISEIHRQNALSPNGVPLEKDTKLQRELKALDEEYEAAINNKKEKQQAAAKIAQREADAKAAKDKIIADEEARKKAEEDRQAAEQKQIDAFKVRMSPEEEKAFWDKNKPAMDALEKTLNDRNKELQKQQADKKAWDESGGPEKVRQEYEKQRKENEERRRRFSEGRTPEQQDNLRRMLEGLPPLTSATSPGRRKRSFAPEGTAPSFAPEGGDIKVTVKPEQKEVVTAITAQTTAIVKAFGKSGKLGA